MRRAIPVTLLSLLAAGGAWAQQPGPIQPPDDRPIIRRIPLHPEVPAPPLPPEQIAQRFTVNEEKYQEAFRDFGYKETIRVEELGGANRTVSGSITIHAQIYLKPNGEKYERILNSTANTLQYLHLSSQDLQVLADMPRFPLAGNAAAEYNFTYRGTEKLDTLETYAFQVEPKTMQPGKYYFSGIVWVDNEDLAIVKSYGQFESTQPPSPNTLPFSYFETYRENTEGKYWFPSYIRSEDVITKNQAELPIRLIIRASDFQPGGPAPLAPKAASPPSH